MGNSLALYRKYRGLTFDDIKGQSHITDALKSAVRAGRISHAYLLTGPHGVGKTSIARILAHMINDLEYTHEDKHIDIIEIDAASNRRIDEIRDLREKSHIAPVAAKYKVYIIDEVHMLTKEAFNALLKTLEEPPSHVVFILATTELHKLPQTIISRTQRYSFKPIEQEEAFNHLKSIAEKEHFEISDDAIRLIADHGNGSFRDAISLFDQIANSEQKKISENDVRSMLGLAGGEVVSGLVEAVKAGDTKSVIDSLNLARGSGVQPQVLAAQIIDMARNSDQYHALLELVEDVANAAAAPNPDLILETTLLRHSGAATSLPTPVKNKAPSIASKPPAQSPKPTEPKLEKPAPTNATPVEVVAAPTPEPVSEPETIQEQEEEQMDAPSGDWNSVITAVKKQNNAIASILRNAEVTENNNTLTLAIKYGFHKKKVEDPAIQSMILKLYNKPGIKLDLIVKEDAQQNTSTSEVEESDPAAKIIEAFGGGERVNL